MFGRCERSASPHPPQRQPSVVCLHSYKTRRALRWSGSQAVAGEHDRRHGPEQHSKFKEGNKGSHKTGTWHKVSQSRQDKKGVYLGRKA